MKMMIKFILLSVLVISPNSIYGDKELMETECRNAKVPTICMKCLESDPNSVRADAHGIADIVIKCLDSSLHGITIKITKLLSSEKGKDDAIIKTTLEDCKRGMSEAITKLPEAINGLQNHDYDKASHALSIALDYPMSCLYNLTTAKFHQSLQLFSQINIYAELSEAALRIIDRF